MALNMLRDRKPRRRRYAQAMSVPAITVNIHKSFSQGGKAQLTIIV